jgi:hypothetical protein
MIIVSLAITLAFGVIVGEAVAFSEDTRYKPNIKRNRYLIW